MGFKTILLTDVGVSLSETSIRGALHVVLIMKVITAGYRKFENEKRRK